jgi:hypothetical protein
MTLTAAGQALADRTPGVLASWDQVLRETKATACRAEYTERTVGSLLAELVDGEGSTNPVRQG